MDGYGQFCPVALTARVLTRRWTPLVIRELLAGSTRFNDLRRGVPRMSPSLLSKRLDELERAGVLERRCPEGGHHPEYHLTEAGEELRPVIETMGVWGKRWLSGELSEEDLDVELLMWDVRRRIDVERAPRGRTVVHFRFTDQPPANGEYWVVVDEGEVDLCRKDPGFPVDLTVETDVHSMTLIWMGRLSFRGALSRGDVDLEGPRELRRSFPDWLGRGLFAPVELAVADGGGPSRA